jgi:hypothetical protein
MSVLWVAVVYAQLQLVLDDSLKAPNGIDFPPSSLFFLFVCYIGRRARRPCYGFARPQQN